MQGFFRIFINLVLSIIAISSCSTIGKGEDADMVEEGGTIIISGMVSDIISKQPIEAVKVCFSAYESTGEHSLPVNEQNVYTDSKGSFSISASGFAAPVTCRITIESEIYKSIQKDLFINWRGTSYDEKTNTFFVNDCNFHLEKK